MAMPNGKTAIVIGGGLVGQACGLALLDDCDAVTLLDPHDDPRAASWGNAGHLAVEQVEPLASLATVRSMPKRLFSRGGALGLPIGDIAAWLPFSVRLLKAALPGSFARGKAALTAILAEALPAWQRLAGAAGASELLIENGHFIVWESAASAAAGRAHWLGADSGTAHFRDATADEMAAIAKVTTATLHGGVRCVGSGQVADPGALAKALDAAFKARGGMRRTASAARVEVVDGRASVVLDTGETLTADAVIVAAGVGARALLEPLGHKVPIIAERGYHIQSAESAWPADLPPVVFEDRSVIVSRFRSGLRAASFVEFGRAASPPDERKWDRLRRYVNELGLPFGLPGAAWMGARPTLPDYLPAIGRSGAASNLFYAFGHQHLGLTLSAVTGEAIAALVAGKPPAIDLAPFDLARFGGRT